MNISTTYPRPHPQTAGRVVDDEAVLILSDVSEINVLNRVGARIFELADGAHSIADIVQVILNEFDVTADEAEADVVAFLTRLADDDVLVLDTRE